MFYSTVSGGFHFWFKVAQGIAIPQRTGIMPLVDIRYSDGYVCVGSTYKIQNDGNIIGCPPEILSWLTAPINDCSKPQDDPESRVVSKVAYDLSPIPSGSRNDTLYRQGCGIACSVREGTASKRDIYEIIHLRGRLSGLSYDECDRILSQIYLRL
jgi:hypothetical protein